MKDKFIRYGFEKVIGVEKLITVFYAELSKTFTNEGERHDFWEMVYVDRGEVLCTAGKRQFALKSGELTFHKPNEFHAIRSYESSPNFFVFSFVNQKIIVPLQPISVCAVNAQPLFLSKIV